MTRPASAPLVVVSRSEEETRAFGARLAAVLDAGDLVGLCGDLGAGKTCLVRGLAEGLGIPPTRVRSPTFTLIAEYGGGRVPLYHLDLYRLEPTAVDQLALREYLDGDGICVVEWFEHLHDEAPRFEVHLTFVGPTERRLVVSAHGARYSRCLDQLRSA